METQPGWRDTVERVFWTVAALVLAAIPVAIADIPGWWVIPLTAAVNWLLVEVRKHTPLPSPGAGLPGLPTES